MPRRRKQALSYEAERKKNRINKSASRSDPNVRNIEQVFLIVNFY